jgi:hypothetical protein
LGDPKLTKIMDQLKRRHGERGYVLHDDINELIDDDFDLDSLDSIYGELTRLSIPFYDSEEVAREKIKKDERVPEVTLESTPDILAEIGKRKGRRILVGFAAETQDLVANARKKLQRKNLDLMVANDVSQSGAGFDADTNLVKILDATGGVEELPLLPKPAVADRILDRVVQLVGKRR